MPASSAPKTTRVINFFMVGLFPINVGLARTSDQALSQQVRRMDRKD